MLTVRMGAQSSLEKDRRVNTSAGCYLLRKLENGSLELCVLHKRWPDNTDRYVLPKGHVEGEETLEETAYREVKEESGYTDFKLHSYIGSCTYELDWTKEIQVKTDYYYLAFLDSEERVELKPEKYEADVIVKVVWIDMEKALKLLTFENQKKIHQTIRDILEK